MPSTHLSGPEYFQLGSFTLGRSRVLRAGSNFVALKALPCLPESDSRISRLAASSSTIDTASLTRSTGASRAGFSPRAAAADSRMDRRSSIFVSIFSLSLHTAFLYSCASCWSL